MRKLGFAGFNWSAFAVVLLGIILCGVTICAADGNGLFTDSQEAAVYSGGTAPHSTDAFDKIESAILQGELSLKQAVLLKAKLLYARKTFRVDASSAFLEGVTTVSDPCLTGFYKDVHRVYGQLSTDERNYLASLNENLKTIMRARESEQSIVKPLMGRVAALPDSGLDKKVEGKSCTVNYTESGTDASTAAYAKLIQQYIDQAVIVETKKFRPAYAEGGGKLQIYVVNMAEGTWGQWIDVSAVKDSVKRKTGYINISKNIQNEAGASWKAILKGTCYHEYFHGVQSAYNWESSLWFMEGTCRWAETYYGSNWGILSDTFNDSESVFNIPYKPIWLDTLHKYSTVALAYYFADRYGKDNFILSYFQATEAKDDAIDIFKDLMVAKGTTFDDQFKRFWVAMYTKNISSIKKYMPNVNKEYFNTYGIRNSTNVYQLGARFHQLKTMAGTPSAALLYKYAPDSGTNVTAFTFTGKSKTPVDIPAGSDYHFTDKFGSAVKEVVAVYTDTTYAKKDANVRGLQFEYLLPYIKVTKTSVVPTVMPAGSTSTITFTYNLLGTISGETFPTYFKVTEKGPNVADNASGEYNLNVGIGNNFNVYFYTNSDITPGTYKFTCSFLVPCDSWKNLWGTPQVKSSSSFSVKVIKPTTTASAAQGSGQAVLTTQP